MKNWQHTLEQLNEVAKKMKLSRYLISKETGISESQLLRILDRGQEPKVGTFEKLHDYSVKLHSEYNLQLKLIEYCDENDITGDLEGVEIEMDGKLYFVDLTSTLETTRDEYTYTVEFDIVEVLGLDYEPLES